MKIKTKLRLGFGFLFFTVLIFGLVSGYYLNKISRDSKIILDDNYETLSLTREMRRILDENNLPLSKPVINQFDTLIKKQQLNVTEYGEAELTYNLRRFFERLRIGGLSYPEQEAIRRLLRNNLSAIENLNMEAIVRKNARAQASVEKAIAYMSLIGCFIILVLFSFSVNFPSFIANPLLELTEGIKEISNKNYLTRLDFHKGDEFAPIGQAFNDMAAKLNEWESSNLANIMSEKVRIETIINQMQDGIIGLNEGNQVIFINPVAEELLNLKQANIVGINVADLAKKNDLLKKLIENKQNDKPIKIFADGRESHFQLESWEIKINNYLSSEDSPLIKSGKSAGEVFILKNITKFQELDEAKTHFIATISHELKTPIASIKMSLKLLRDERVGELNNEQTTLLDHINYDAQRLLKITSELLDLAQVETGNIHLNFVSADPNEIMNYAVNAVQAQAQQKGISIECSSAGDIPHVQADVEKTTWVLINFLSNAIRYSSDNARIIVHLKSDQNGVEFSVKDYGKGIEEQYQEKLFDRYFQVPTDGKNKSGTGLGLSIAKDFILAQGGKIWVESSIGEGSKFAFLLPII